MTKPTNGVRRFGQRAQDDTPRLPFEVVAYRGEEERVWKFTALPELSGGAWLSMVMAKEETDQAKGVAWLLFEALADDDGLSWHYKPEEDGPDDRLDDIEQWSSKRRFDHLISGHEWRVGLSTLTDIVQWLTEETGQRPTERPSRSAPGPQAATTGSKARRR